MFDDPKVFVINLDERADRWKSIQKLCNDASLVPARVSAIRDAIGWVGSGYTHLKCVQRAKDEQLPWILVLEDDATFTPESIRRFRSLLPFLWENRDKWERFNGGPTFPPNPSVSILSKDPPLVYAQGFTAHFYLIHSTTYDIILQWRPERHKAIDVYFFDLECRFRTVFNSVATCPHISLQATGESDIERREVDYSSFFEYSEAKIRDCLGH
jgi:hypothetical protein